MDLLAVVFVVALAKGFNYTNGSHDAANAIATSVSTRALTPRIALVMAAVFNLFGPASEPRWPIPSVKASSTHRPAPSA